MGLLDDAFRAIRLRLGASEPSSPAAPFSKGPGPTQEELARILPQLFELRAKYRGFADPYRACNRDEAQAAIHEFYKALGLSAPAIVWLASPLAAVRTGMLWSAYQAFKAADNDSEVLNRVKPLQSRALHDRISYGRLHVQTRFHAFNAAVARAVDYRDFFNPPRARIDGALYKAVVDSFDSAPSEWWKQEMDKLSAVHPNLRELKKFIDWFWSQTPEQRTELLAKIALCEFNAEPPTERQVTSLFPRIGPNAVQAPFESGDLLVAFTVESLIAWGQKPGAEFLTVPALTKHCPWWRAENGVCIASESPVEVHRDENGRLHRFDGPAVRYADGFSLYYIRGIRVWEDTAFGRFTAEDIDAERNVEFRRAMIERFGPQNYIATGAYLIDEHPLGTLYFKHLDGDEPIAMVKVKNSTPEPDGTFKYYFLRVPPTVQTAAEAVAWTFDMDEKDYHPHVET